MRIAVLALLAAASAQAESRSVAVLDFRNKLAGDDRAAVDASYLADQVRVAALRAAPSLRVITRENLLVLLEATGKDLANCEGECEVETGRRIGADLVVSGELLKFGSSFKLDMRLHDTQEGRLLSGATASGPNADALDRDLPRAIARLLEPISAGRAVSTSLPAVPAGRAPLLVMARGVLGASNQASFHFSVQTAEGGAACDQPVTIANPCRLAVPPGAITAAVSGDAQMSESFRVAPGGGTVNINYAGRALLWWGLGAAAAGATGIGIGIATSSDGGKIAGFTAGGMAAFFGLGLLLANAVVGTAATRLTFDASSR